MWHLATTGGGAGEAVGALVEFGVLGALVVLLGVFAYRSYRREVDRADRLEAENGRLRDSIEGRVVPLVERALAIIDGYGPRHPHDR